MRNMRSGLCRNNVRYCKKMGTHYSCGLDYRLGAVHVSAKGKKVIQQMVKVRK